MLVLDLIAEVAYRRPDERGRPPRALAVVDEAFALAGFAPGATVDTLYADDPVDFRLERVGLARKHLNREKLRTEARGMLLAIDVLLDGGLDPDTAARARVDIWREAKTT